MRHELSHDPPPTIPVEPVLINTVPDPTDQNPTPKDDIFDYHCGFMNMALLLRNFMDAIKGQLDASRCFLYTLSKMAVPAPSIL